MAEVSERPHRSSFRSLRWIAAGLFFASGFCSLLYQLIWLRLAFAHFGVITAITSVVVSVFMLGLGAGSYFGGRIALRFSPDDIRPYAFAEILSGIGAWAVPFLYGWGDRWFLVEGLSSGAALFRSSVVIAVSLVPWCTAMGSTFPLMMNYFKPLPEHDRSFSLLYTANLLGAGMGILWTVIVSVEWLGFHRSLMLAGVINFLIGAFALLFLRPHRPSDMDVHPWKVTSLPPSETAAWKLMCVLFTTGLISLGLEMVWLRAFSPILGTTIYAFAAVLFVYLFSGWVGTLYYRGSIQRGANPSLAQILSWIVLVGLFPLVATDFRLQFGPLIVLLSIVPTCVAWGLLTPRLLDQVGQGEPASAGRAYAWNIVGCIVGPLLASYGLLPFVSANTAVLIFLGSLLAMNLLLFKNTVSKKLLLVALVGWVAAFRLQDFETGIGLSMPPSMVRRDPTASVVAAGVGMDRMLFVNGIGITRLTPVTKIMAHLPLALLNRPSPKVLLICFGMGSTFRSMLSWNVSTTAVELVPSVKQCFPFFFADAAAVLANPRGRIVIDDGRRFLRNTRQMFDLITLDPPPPVEAAASSLLYSSDFYRLAKTHLTPGGVLEQWFPFGEYKTFQAIAQSLHESFTYVRVFPSFGNWGFYFLASEQPLQVPSAQAFWKRLPPAAQKDFMEWFSIIPPIRIVERMLGREQKLEVFLPASSRCHITDDQPYNEYYLLRRLRGQSVPGPKKPT